MNVVEALKQVDWDWDGDTVEENDIIVVGVRLSEPLADSDCEGEAVVVAELEIVPPGASTKLAVKNVDAPCQVGA